MTQLLLRSPIFIFSLGMCAMGILVAVAIHLDTAHPSDALRQVVCGNVK